MIDTIKKSIHYNRFWLIREIKKRVKPFLHSSGYCDEHNADGYVQLVAFKQEHRLRTAGYVGGFTSNGLMGDAWGWRVV